MNATMNATMTAPTLTLPAAILPALERLLTAHIAAEREAEDRDIAAAVTELAAFTEPDELVAARKEVPRLIAAVERAAIAHRSAQESLDRARYAYNLAQAGTDARRAVAVRRVWPIKRQRETRARLDDTMDALRQRPEQSGAGGNAALSAALRPYFALQATLRTAFEHGSPLELDTLMDAAALESHRGYEVALREHAEAVAAAARRRR